MREKMERRKTEERERERKSREKREEINKYAGGELKNQTRVK